MLTTDHYFLACKPLLYPVIVTKTRVLYFTILSWILSGILAASVFLHLYHVIDIVLAAKIFVFTLLPVFSFLVFVIMILNIRTWRTVARHGNRVSSLGRQNGNRAKNSQSRADKKRLENQSRFAKVILLLLLNLGFFVLPQVLMIVINCVNIWCELCVPGLSNRIVILLQVYFFPLFFYYNTRTLHCIYTEVQEIVSLSFRNRV